MTMALVNCVECGARISDKAVSCPKCGSLEPLERKGFGNCPECDTPLSIDAPVCPNCGLPHPLSDIDLNMKILIVDDNRAMLRLTQMLLKKLGFNNTTTAIDGHQALEELKRESVDLILSDWNMPNMDGLEFLTIVKSNETFKDIPFVMLTARGEELDVVKAVKAGATSYIVKPFSPETLADKLKTALLG
jgi:two-component system chemotaxis response regulator CheY